MDTSSRPSVLVVDDDRLNRLALAELLRDDCRVLLAKDGPSAMQLLARGDIDLILLDVSMPGADGYEVIAAIRSTPAFAETGVIFITGRTNEADEERGLALGAADYIQKPIRPAIVRARVKLHLKLALQRRELERMSREDALTGIANRRHFDQELDRAARRMARVGIPLGLAIFDVDHFKLFNDAYGHPAGDRALRSVAEIIRAAACRIDDVAGRYGGEEFVLMMPEVENMGMIAERIRQEVLARSIAHERSPTASFLTVSGGALTVDAGACSTPASLLERADALLYEAKRGGRNRIATESSVPSGGDGDPDRAGAGEEG